jgi:D-psicose/D-tagatose/L-ribulose 3-epimerase
MNKIGITTWVWTSPLGVSTFRELAPHIKSIGYDMVEVPIEGVGGLDYAEIGRIARDAGLDVSVCAVIGADRDLLDANEAVRANGMAYVRHSIDAAATVGSPHLVGPLYSAVGRTWLATADERRRDMDLLVEELSELAAYGSDKGIAICIEPLNRFETSFINTAEQAVELVDRVGSPSCAIVLDTFHMNIEELSMGRAIRTAGRRLRHLQVSDNHRGTPGDGHVPWQEVAEACRDIDYRGAVVIETFTTEVKSIARAVSIWRPLAASQDALAREGLAFLRGVFSNPAR